MLNPELAGRIVKEVSKAVSLPVTVKFRKGFDADHINAPEFAQIMEEKRRALSKVSFSFTITFDIDSHLTSLQL